MSKSVYSHEQIIQAGQFTPEDLSEILQRRRDHNRLGFAYQMAFVRLANRFPAQQPLEVLPELLTYVGLQLGIKTEAINLYAQRQPTITEHRQAITLYDGVRRFEEAERQLLANLLFTEASRLEQTGPLLNQAKRFLSEQSILYPGDEVLRRLVAKQRQAARDHIYERITKSLGQDTREKLDELLETKDAYFTALHILKQPPGRPSPSAILRLTTKLQLIRKTGALNFDLSWLNNNYQRSLARYVRHRSAGRLKRLKSKRRYAALVCFLHQLYADTIDFLIEMHDKLMTGVYTRAENNIAKEMNRRRRAINRSLATFHTLGTIVLDDSIDDGQLRRILFQQIDKESLTKQVSEVDKWLTDKHSHVFHQVTQRYTYLRQFAPALLEAIELQSDTEIESSVVKAVALLRDMNQEGKRKLPEDAPLGFMPKKVRSLVEEDGVISRRDWECALLTAIRDEIRIGNVVARSSKRFGRFDNFFISNEQWATQREAFYQRAGLPVSPADVQAYLTARLNRAYDDFLASLPENTYAAVDNDGWVLSTDSAEKPDKETEKRLENLESWLSDNLRQIKLPELLIEVDNELNFTQPFLPSVYQTEREPESVCHVLATIMAYGCNIGPFTMARLTDGVTYNQIKRISDWQLSEEAQRQALAQLVNAISSLDVTRHWGEGKTSSSDGQRFRYKQKVLQQTWSPRFQDYALEFYSFVADNYAPFYSIPIECTDRDAAYVLDGLLYNESDLAIEEHYTDTHGYTEINFAAFAMLGRRFSPRIRAIQKQRIYRIDQDKDYGALTPLVKPRDRIAHLNWIVDQWDRMGHFYASLESGHTTASTGLKRLVGYTGKNHFYRANRELGRIFKTEHILRVMSDPLTRRRMRRGLLKSEEMHALARQVSYGKQGKISARDLHAQLNTSNCLTIIMACIIYWQAKEISRVIQDHDAQMAGIDLNLLEHISPIGWENIILYGEYVLNRNLVQQ
jgi:TnpA family transposase